MSVSVGFIKTLENVDPQLRRVLLELLEELERQREESITKKEFNELKEVVHELGATVKELVETQKQARKDHEIFKKENQENFGRVWQSINELTEVQKRIEKESRENFNRVWQSISELTEAQKRTEKELENFKKETHENFNRVWQSINELTEAQKRTEKELENFKKETHENFNRVWQSINELTEAQKRTEKELESFKKETHENFNRVWQSISELTEAQKRTEKELGRLTREMVMVKERLEGISDTVGYTIENRAYKTLPQILADHGIKVEGRLIRRYLKIKGTEHQVNIFGYAQKNGEKILILGEAKVRPSKKEIARFEKLCEYASEELKTPVFKVFVAHDFPPVIEAYLKEHDFLPVWSYELE